MSVKISGNDIIVAGGKHKVLLQLSNCEQCFAFVTKSMTFGDAAHLVNQFRESCSDADLAVISKNLRAGSAYMDDVRKSNYTNCPPIV